MKRVLCIIGGMNAGGAETFLMKVYRRLDKTKYQIDFAVVNDGVYDAEIQSAGGRIFHITPKTKGPIKNFNGIRQLVKREKYEYVLRVSQHSLSALELLAAKLGGAKIRIFRSSNTNVVSDSRMEKLLHRVFIYMPRLFANVRIAPSTEAAEFMYGKNCIKKKKAVLLHNGLDLTLFRYNESARKRIREELNIAEDAVIIGHVGRFYSQKNHEFLLDIYDSIHKKNSHTKLMLVGTGELENEIRAKVDRLGLNDSVIFTGVRSDVPDLLSAMDVFVFPSFYEGMPNAVIEAQAAGLPCVIADTITKEADITGLVSYLALSQPADAWAQAALDQVSAERQDTEKLFREQKYDIESVVSQFTQIIFCD